jgi:hypothetical protein
MVMYNECGAIDGMLAGGNRSTRRKPALVLLCPPEIPHDLTRVRTLAIAVGNRPLTVWATAGLYHEYQGLQAQASWRKQCSGLLFGQRPDISTSKIIAIFFARNSSDIDFLQIV